MYVFNLAFFSKEFMLICISSYSTSLFGICYFISAEFDSNKKC